MIMRHNWGIIIDEAMVDDKLSYSENIHCLIDKLVNLNSREYRDEI